MQKNVPLGTYSRGPGPQQEEAFAALCRDVRVACSAIPWRCFPWCNGLADLLWTAEEQASRNSLSRVRKVQVFSWERFSTRMRLNVELMVSERGCVSSLEQV